MEEKEKSVSRATRLHRFFITPWVLELLDDGSFPSKRRLQNDTSIRLQNTNKVKATYKTFLK